MLAPNAPSSSNDMIMPWVTMSNEHAHKADIALRESYTAQSYVQIENFLPADIHSAMVKEVNANQDKFEIHIREPGGEAERLPLQHNDPRPAMLRERAESFIRDSVFTYCYQVLELMNMPRDGTVVHMVKHVFHRENLRRISSLTGHDVDKTLFVGISRYREGDFLGPHRDATHTNDRVRLAALNYCLERPSIGGDLVYRQPDGTENAIELAPNSLTLFDLQRNGVHFVRPAIPSAIQRTSIVGFLCKSLDSPETTANLR